MKVFCLVLTTATLASVQGCAVEPCEDDFVFVDDLFGDCVPEQPVTSGEIMFLEEPPTDAGHMQLQSNEGAHLWAEQECIEIDEETYVSISLANSNLPSDLEFNSGIASVQNTWHGYLPAETKYSSYFIHADKQGQNQEFEFSASFDCEIQGIVYRNRPGYKELFMTDETFGNPGTTYSGGASQRGYELDGSKNFMKISEDKKTFSASMVVAHNMDDIRIITCCCE